MSNHPDNNTAAAKHLSLTALPLLYFPPFYAREILVMLFYDITIVCSIHFGRKTTVHAQMNCRRLSAYLLASMPINRFNWKYEMSSFHFQTHFHACDTLPPGIQCALIP